MSVRKNLKLQITFETLQKDLIKSHWLHSLYTQRCNHLSACQQYIKHTNFGIRHSSLVISIIILQQKHVPEGNSFTV